MTRLGFLLFPDMPQLDFTSPYGILAAGSESEMYLVWKETAPIRTSDNPAFTPNTS